MKRKIYLKMLAAVFVILFFSCQKNNETTPANSDMQLDEMSGLKQTKNSEPEVILFAVEDAGGNVPDENSDLLFENTMHNPVLAPDGHQVTFGEWSAATGSASVKCTNNGTNVKLHLKDLIPNGTYTAWTLTFQAPGYDGTEASIMANITGVGSLGLNDGSQNVFQASANGTGHISATVPAGSLSLFGSAGNCLLTDEFEFHFVVLYHIDQMTYGPFPGPDGTKAEQLRFVFNN